MRHNSILVTLGIAIAMIVSVGGAPARAESIGCGPEEVKDTSKYINELVNEIDTACKEERVGDALSKLEEFAKWPLAPDRASCRLTIAKLMVKEGMNHEAVDLLKLLVKDDPYNRCTPEALMLLSSTIYYNLNDHNSYGEYITKLATDYYPEIPVVKQVRASCGENPPDSPKEKKILLDESLHEASIFGRFHLGSTNFCQWDVIRTLGEAGFTVHDNGWVNNASLTMDIMNRYGLVIMNGGSSEVDASIPQQAIKEIVDYVNGGGRLLVVCASKTLGRGCEPQYLNQLMRKFGMSFDEDYTTGGSTVKCTPLSHSLMNDIKEFKATFGTNISGGTAVAMYNESPIIAVKSCGKGMVIAAGIGTGLMGNTIGDLYRYTDKQKAEAQVNRQFILTLVRNILSGVR